MKKIKNFQKISDAAFISHLLVLDPSLYLDSYREDVNTIQEYIKAECDVDLSYIEAFYFWCWRSEKVTDFHLGDDEDAKNDMREKHNVDFEWWPVTNTDAGNMGRWFLEFTSQFVSLGFGDSKADEKKPDTVMKAPIRKSFKMNKKTPPGEPNKMR